MDALNQLGGTPLHDAALGGKTEVIEILLIMVQKSTPLTGKRSYSADDGGIHGPDEAVSTLLSRGADPKIRDRNGHSALDRAHESGFADAEKTLRQALKPTTASRPIEKARGWPDGKSPSLSSWVRVEQTSGC